MVLTDVGQILYSNSKKILASKSLVNSELDEIKKGNYKGYSKKAEFDISDYWKEYFKGIKYHKKSSLSDLTMFKLNQVNSSLF